MTEIYRLDGAEFARISKPGRKWHVREVGEDAVLCKHRFDVKVPEIASQVDAEGICWSCFDRRTKRNFWKRFCKDKHRNLTVVCVFFYPELFD